MHLPASHFSTNVFRDTGLERSVWKPSGCRLEAVWKHDKQEEVAWKLSGSRLEAVY
jgi:hypothetical protein